MKSGIELISIERKDQIEKHGHSLERDMTENTCGELLQAAGQLLHKRPQSFDFPDCWSYELINKVLNKTHKERLVIAGALIAAEIDRLQAQE